MDVAPVIDESPTKLTKPAWRMPFGSASSISLGVFVSFSCSIQAQTQTVEVAVEPNLASSPISVPIDTAQSKEKPKTVEPDRMQPPRKGDPTRKNEAKKPASNFLPAQSPIGRINIDLRSKPKNGSNVVPENLAQKAMGQFPVVQASRSDEMLGDMVFAKSRNHDELFAHQPLYFEEANLERYGRTCGLLQPTLSGVRFFATIPSLPYAMTEHHPRKTYTTRWPFEAGWGAPKVKELQPLQIKPSLVQAGAISGLLLVVP